MKRPVLAVFLAAAMGAAAVPITFAPTAAMAQMSTYTVKFALGSATLSNSAEQVVADAAAAFMAGDSPKIELVGHTDTTGSAGFNQRLSEKRAEAVQAALLQNGVSPGAIEVRAVGQNNLIVPTGDGVNEPANRVVVIDTDPMQGQQPAAKPEVVPAVTPASEKYAFKRFQVEPGLYFGYNGSQDRNLLGGNLSATYWVTEHIGVGGEQALFFPLSGDGGVGARSVASIDYSFGDVADAGSMGGLGVTVGLNGGLIYGDGVNDDWIYGPEIGMNLGPFKAKLAYDISDAGLDDSTVSATLGYTLRF